MRCPSEACIAPSERYERAGKYVPLDEIDVSERPDIIDVADGDRRDRHHAVGLEQRVRHERKYVSRSWCPTASITPPWRRADQLLCRSR